jgi:hypothetical protein
MTAHVGFGGDSTNGKGIRRISLTTETHRIVRRVAVRRKVAFSQIVREAIARYAGSIDVSTLPRERRDPMRRHSMKFGPRMTETIRARCTSQGVNTSAFVEACCLRYLKLYSL